MGLIPLSIYVHKGFWNLFTLFTWLGFIGSIFIILGSIAGCIQISPEYEKKSQADKNIELKRIIADMFAKPIYKRGGVDLVHAETEQKFLDYTFHWAITVWLVFSGHIFFGIMWLVKLTARAILQIGYEAFDESIIEKI